MSTVESVQHIPEHASEGAADAPASSLPTVHQHGASDAALSTMPAQVPLVHAPAPAASASPSTGNWSWVPIRSLAPRQRERILAHLLGLDSHSRYLRFGYAATDAQIARYVDRLDFERDEVFGIFNRRLDLIAMAHLAYPVEDADALRPAMAEFGVSVLAQARRRGFGRRLFEHAMLHARNRGVGAIFIHALSENTAMLKLARDAGATVRRDGSESEAWLELPPDTFASHLDAFVEAQAAEFDYRLKAQLQQVEKFLHLRSIRAVDTAPEPSETSTQPDRP
jgi:ribosomal protein S18 acetylase RimI-like enzyme